MAASMYIVVEGDDPGFDTYVHGHLLARYESEMEALAVEVGARPLLDFFSADKASMELLIEQGAGNPALLGRLPPPQWHDSHEGLATIEALIATLETSMTRLGDAGPEVLSELRGYERVLRKSAERGLRWHIAVSWE